MNGKKICVYKITSPSKKVYIGSTIDFTKRLNRYKNLGCKQQVRLYNSFVKYGFDKHKVEILCYCDKEDVRQKEAYYGQLFNCLGDKGLNCNLPAHGEGFITKSAESIEKHRALMIGRKASDTAKLNMSKAQMGRVVTDEMKKAIGDKNRGKVQGLAQRQKTTERLTGKKWTEKSIQKRRLTQSNILLNPQTGIYYYGFKDAANSIGMAYSTLFHRLHKSKVNTPFILTA